MKDAALIARSTDAQVAPEHVAYAFARTASAEDTVAAVIHEYGRSRGWDDPKQRSLLERVRIKRPAVDTDLRRAIEKEASAGRASVPSVLLLLLKQGEFDDLSRAVTEAGGDLHEWLMRHAG